MPSINEHFMTESQKKAALFIGVGVVIIFLALFFRNPKKDNGGDEADLPVKEMYNMNFDFDSPSELQGINLDSIHGKSGHSASYYNDTLEFGATFKRAVTDLKDYEKIREVYFSFNINSEKDINDAVAVITIESPDGKSNHWDGVDIHSKAGSWEKKEQTFKIRKDKLNPYSTLKIFVWNRGKEKFLIDDFQIRFSGI